MAGLVASRDHRGDDGELRLPEGTVVEGIEVVSEIDRGGMAVVYRGRRVCDGRPVALKVGTAEAARHQTEERFNNEARLGGEVHHRNVVRPLQVGQLSGPDGFAGRMYLVTELVPGRTLRWLMVYHQQGMPVGRAVAIALQLAEAMVAMHERGIVHRDLKPANVIVDDEDRVHVIDFGLAYALGDAGSARSRDLTIEGAAPGTPLYMSPQQAMHLEPHRAFDVYAFGVILYELLSGAAPNSGLPSGEVAAARCNPKARLFPLCRLAPEAPPSLVALVESCLEYEPERRPQATEIVEALSVLRVGTAAEVDAVERRLIPIMPSVPSTRTAETKAAISIVAEDEGAASIEVEPEVEAEPEVGDDEVVGLAVRPSRPRRAGWVLGVLVVGLGGGLLAMRGASRPEAGAALSALPDIPRGEPAVVNEGEVDSVPSIDPTTSPPIEGSSVESPDGQPESPLSVEPPARKKRRRAGRAMRKTAEPQPAAKPRATPCAAQRAAAREAKASRKWNAVLASTKDAFCWSSAEERTRLRANALINLKRYSACINETHGAADAQVVRLGKECYRRLTQEQE